MDNAVTKGLRKGDETSENVVKQLGCEVEQKLMGKHAIPGIKPFFSIHVDGKENWHFSWVSHIIHA